MDKIRIGFLGAGSVGGSMISQISAESLPFAIVAAGVREPNRRRSHPTVRLTDDLMSIATDPTIEVIIDVTRLQDTSEAVTAALESGKTVISTNKDYYAGQVYEELDSEKRKTDAAAEAVRLVDELKLLITSES
jgi:homoserine dehydrogenase